VVRAERDDPVAAAGHSLGELAALVAAGAIDAEEALELVVLRGTLMAQARDGSMLALLGARDDEAEALAAEHGVVVANLNAPGQHVLAGDADRLDALAAVARGRGLRALELGVTGAFHSAAMAPFVGPFAEALRAAAWREPRFPVVSCATARPFADPAAELATALVRPVRWVDTMRALRALGADEFVDAGPGRVLAKLVPRIFKEEAAHA
jgi:malonyl CoA-acyl carrier protein transacylase